MNYSLNDVCVIAASLEDLSRHPDHPVHIDGDVWVGEDVIEMDQDEAYRVVVDRVLTHPLLVERDTYAEECFSAIRWMIDQMDLDYESIPETHRAAIWAAKMSNMMDDIDNID
jgi:hypothetical protein